MIAFSSSDFLAETFSKPVFAFEMSREISPSMDWSFFAVVSWDFSEIRVSS